MRYKFMLLVLPAQGRHSTGYAIAFNGKYPDRHCGELVEYHGVGGRGGDSTQMLKTEHQSWDAAANKALLLNWWHNVPVRVLRKQIQRGRPVKEVGPLYTYDGLYRVESCRTQLTTPSGPVQAGLRICVFTLRGIPGHFNRNSRPVAAYKRKPRKLKSKPQPREWPRPLRSPALAMAERMFMDTPESTVDYNHAGAGSAAAFDEAGSLFAIVPSKHPKLEPADSDSGKWVPVGPTGIDVTSVRLAKDRPCTTPSYPTRQAIRRAGPYPRPAIPERQLEACNMSCAGNKQRMVNVGMGGLAELKQEDGANMCALFGMGAHGNFARAAHYTGISYTRGSYDIGVLSAASLPASSITWARGPACQSAWDTYFAAKTCLGVVKPEPETYKDMSDTVLRS
jgi:hypothetical protein